MKLLLYLFIAWVPIVGLAWFSEVSALAAPGQVKCSWDANVETNVAGYKVLWGPASRSYNQTNIVTGRFNNTVTVSLPSGVSYLVVQAFADDRAESLPSYEIVWTNSAAPPIPPKNFKVSAVIQAAVTTNGPWRNLARVAVSLPPGGESEEFRAVVAVEKEP